MKKVFICDDNITAMYSAIYDAWKECRDEEAGIEIRGQMDQQLFYEYIEVEEDSRKAIVLEKFIKKNLGMEAYHDIYYALLSEDTKKADAVFHTIQTARSLKNSKKIMEHLTDDYVEKVFELSRNVRREAYRFLEFVRFRELESGILFSEITPKNHVLTCIGDHFSDRFPMENWVIYDKGHQEFIVHQKQHNWIMICGEEIERSVIERISEEEKEYQKLWKGFFKTIAIEERRNPVCQRNHVPIRCREDMIEFQ